MVFSFPLLSSPLFSVALKDLCDVVLPFLFSGTSLTPSPCPPPPPTVRSSSHSFLLIFLFNTLCSLPLRFCMVVPSTWLFQQSFSLWVPPSFFPWNLFVKETGSVFLKNFLYSRFSDCIPVVSFNLLPYLLKISSWIETWLVWGWCCSVGGDVCFHQEVHTVW